MEDKTELCKECGCTAEVVEGGEPYCKDCLYDLWQEYIRVLSGRDPGDPDAYPFHRH